MTRTERSMLLCAALASAAASLSASGGPAYSLSVLVDGTAVPEYAARNRVYVEALKGREFVLRITNPTGRRVAVALSVDGRNVIDAKRTGSQEAAKWVLSPWETIDVPGWQVSGATARRFFFTETSKSYAKWLGDTANVGTIEAVFYRERERQPEPPQPLTRYKESPAAREPQAGASGKDEGQAAGVPGGTGDTLAEKASPPTAQSSPRRAEGGRRLRRDRHRRRDRVSRPVGRVRGRVLAGRPDRAPLRVPDRARSSRRAAETRRAFCPRPRAWLRARVRTRSVPALSRTGGCAREAECAVEKVRSRRRFGGASRL